MEPDASILSFGTFELDSRTRELRRQGRLVALQPQACDALILLVRNAGEPVTREQLREHLWGQNTFVEADQGMNACIRRIRRALDDSARAPRFVETIPQVGYRFIAPLNVASSVLVVEAPRFRLGGWRVAAALLVLTAVSAAAIGLSRREASEPAPSRSDVPGAQDAYMRGRFLLEQRQPDLLDQGRDRFAEAVSLDPGWADAHAGLATAWNTMAFAGQAPSGEAFGRAAEAAQRSLTLSGENVEALIALGYTQLYFDHAYDQAAVSLERAVRIAPSNPKVRSALASLRAVTGAPDVAVVEARKALDLDPLSKSSRADLCWYLLYADQFHSALSACRTALELEVDDQWALMGLAEAQRLTGDEAGQLSSLLRAFKVSADGPQSADELWKALSDRLSARPHAGGSFTAAAIHANAGQEERALEALQQVADSNSFWMVYLRVDPRFDSLHRNEHFRAMADAIGLPGITP